MKNRPDQAQPIVKDPSDHKAPEHGNQNTLMIEHKPAYRIELLQMLPGIDKERKGGSFLS